MIQKKIKMIAEETQSPEWSYSPQEIVEMLEKGPLLMISGKETVSYRMTLLYNNHQVFIIYLIT